MFQRSWIIYCHNAVISKIAWSENCGGVVSYFINNRL